MTPNKTTHHLPINKSTHTYRKPHLKTTPQTNSYQKPRRHPKQNSPIHNYAYHFITTKRKNTHTTRNLNPNPKPKPKTHSKYNTNLKPHNIHNYHTKGKLQQTQNTQSHNAMASAYQPTTQTSFKTYQPSTI